MCIRDSSQPAVNALLQAKMESAEKKGVDMIVEVGTPLSLMYGIEAVRKVKERYPELVVLDDIKLCDGGKRSSHACLSKGADMITVLGISDKATIQAGVEAVSYTHLHGPDSS